MTASNKKIGTHTLGGVLVLLLWVLAATAQAAGTELVSAARKQVGVTFLYDRSYVRLEYPGGDISRFRGVCTDVVIRALRTAWNLDLQQLIHEDMRENFSAYPDHWGLTRPDRNIDHRRVPNIETWLQRQGAQLATAAQLRNPSPEQFLPGDIVTSRVNGNLPHIMIVSDRKTRRGVPLVIHNIGLGAREENALFDHPLTGHFRLLPPDQLAATGTPE